MTSEVQQTHFGFIIHEYNKCIYSKKLDNYYIILCLYVDDVLIFDTSLDAIQMLKDYLSQNFYMKNLDPTDWYWEWKYSELLMEFLWV